MKKLFILLCITFVAFSQSEAKEKPVPTAVLHAFFTTFKNATDITWDQANGFTVASFTIDNHKQYAYYNASNELYIVAEPIAVNRLPQSLQDELRAVYKRYVAVDIFKMVENGATTYSAVVENSRHKIILKNAGDMWEEAKVVRK